MARRPVSLRPMDTRAKILVHIPDNMYGHTRREKELYA